MAEPEWLDIECSDVDYIPMGMDYSGQGIWSGILSRYLGAKWHVVKVHAQL
jgi:predicted hydrocarbon binding protein